MNYKDEYKRLRAKNWNHIDSRNTAKINCAFEKAEAKELVRFRVISDDLPYDDSYIDTWPESDEEKAKTKKQLWARIEREGVWCILVEKHITCKHCGSDRWEQLEHCCGFVGEDWKDSGYDTDFKRTALEAIGVKA